MVRSTSPNHVDGSGDRQSRDTLGHHTEIEEMVPGVQIHAPDLVEARFDGCRSGERGYDNLRSRESGYGDRRSE